MLASRRTITLLACVLAVAVPALSHAQNKKVPGEKWKQSVQMEMGGMKIPTQNFEVCVPVGKASEALSRPPNNAENCALSNTQQSGNKFSGDIHCTGKQQMDGHIESQTDGNHTVTKMQMNTAGMAMVMNMDATKIGTACEATDYSELKAKAEAAQAAGASQMAQVCQQMSDRFTKTPRDLSGAVALYADKNGQCATHATKKNFCSAVQTPAGFASLSNQERAMAKSGGEKNAMTAPLTTALQSCSLGSAEALRTKLLATAEKENNWDFLVAEGNDATYAMLTSTARRECAGRSFTNAPAGRYAELCRKYGVTLARNDRSGAQSAAGVISDAPSGSGSASTSSTATAPASDEAADGQPAKKTGTLDKTKKKLKSLFGGGSGD